MKENLRMKKLFTYIPTKLNFNLILMGLLLITGNLQAQSVQETDKKIKKETNKLLKTAEDELGDNDFASAEASYRKAVSKNESSATARYNMANMYYGKEKPAQATSRYKQAAKVAETKDDKHDVFHNLGNSLMDQKKYQEAIDAYKNALRNNPKDDETRYNLALAKQKLEKEQQENKDDKGDNKDDKKDQDQDKKDQDQDKKEEDKGDKEKKDQGDDKEKDGGDKEDEPKKEPEKQDENGDPQNKKEQEDQKSDQEKEQPQQPKPGQLSPQQIKSLLEAMNNEEKKVQDKMNAEKAKGVKTRTAKDW